MRTPKKATKAPAKPKPAAEPKPKAAAPTAPPEPPKRRKFQPPNAALAIVLAFGLRQQGIRIGAPQFIPTEGGKTWSVDENAEGGIVVVCETNRDSANEARLLQRQLLTERRDCRSRIAFLERKAADDPGSVDDAWHRDMDADTERMARFDEKEAEYQRRIDSVTVEQWTFPRALQGWSGALLEDA